MFDLTAASPLAGLMQHLERENLLVQGVTLVVCLLFARLVVRRLSTFSLNNLPDRVGRHASRVRGIGFPLVALLLVALAREALRPLIGGTVLGLQLTGVHLLSLAQPLLIALLLLRLLSTGLRQTFPQMRWLVEWERRLVLVTWLLAVAYLTGLLGLFKRLLSDITFPLGNSTLNLWVVISAIITVALTLFVALWLDGAISRRVLKIDTLDLSFRIVLSRIMRAVLVLAAFLFSLEFVGINLTALSVFTGALGVGLGFGLQRIASNYLAGFIVLLERSIRIGDVIGLGNDANPNGAVVRITTRHTLLRNDNGRELLVPNETLITTLVQNLTLNHGKPVVVTAPVVIAHQNDLALCQRIMLEAATSHPRVLQQPAPTTLVKSAHVHGITLELVFWVGNPNNVGDAVLSDLLSTIITRMRESGVTFPQVGH